MNRENDYRQFQVLMTGLAEMFDSSPSPVLSQMYWDALSPYNLDDLRAAVKEVIDTHPYNTMPKPAEIINAIPQRFKGPPLLNEPEATAEDLEYGHYQCQFVIWLMGARKVGTTRIPACPGVWHTKLAFKHDGKSRWREAEDPKRRAELWLQFLIDQHAPQRLIDEAKGE